MEISKDNNKINPEKLVQILSGGGPFSLDSHRNNILIFKKNSQKDKKTLLAEIQHALYSLK